MEADEMLERCREWFRLPAAHQAAIEKFQVLPPVKLGKLAEELGLVVKVATLPASVSGEIRRSAGKSSSGFTIRVNKHEKRERQRFTLAHEIAHYLLHRDLIKEELSDDVLYRSKLSNSREAEANRLAAEILMPVHLVAEVLSELGEKPESIRVSVLAEKFGVSEATARIRLG